MTAKRRRLDSTLKKNKIDDFVFRPSEAEFCDFNGYMRKVEKAVSHLTAIVKIIPPANWSPRVSSCAYYTDMDDFPVKMPISERYVGALGCYTKFNSVQTTEISLAEFRQLAQQKGFIAPNNMTEDELGRYYWRSLALDRHRKAIYGADIAGSFFDDEVVDWNLKSLKSTLDNSNKVKIPGVDTPFLYFGMWKTSFAWHCEDQDLFSINYHHFGAPKFWYGLPSIAADRFETLMRLLFPESSSKCGAFLRHKMQIVSPELLDKYGIPYVKLVQKPGEFIVTFPRGYHAGFNGGFNCAEAVNFAIESWIPFGAKAVLCRCTDTAVHLNMAPFLERFHPELLKDWLSRGQLNASGENGSPSTASIIVEGRRRESFIEENNAWRMKVDGLNTRTDSINLDRLRKFNRLSGLESPHCAVCQYFVPRVDVERVTKLPINSKVMVSDLMFAKNPALLVLPDVKEGRTIEDRLLKCKNCHLVVHPNCYDTKSNANQSDQWLCKMCENWSTHRNANCERCALSGGAMVPILGYSSTRSVVPMVPATGYSNTRFVHTICALFDPQCQFVDPKARDCVKLRPVEYRKRGRKSRCIFCGHLNGLLAQCSGIPSCTTTRQTKHFHVTCARFLGGVAMEVRDWPSPCVAICAAHEPLIASAVDSEENLNPLNVNDRVIVTIEGEDAEVDTYRLGEIIQKQLDTFCTIAFPDGALSNDTRPEDIVHCECPNQNNNKCNGRHIAGAQIRVLWNDGNEHPAVFRRRHQTYEYTVRLDDSGVEEVVRVFRGKLYGRDDHVADEVLDKIGLDVAIDWLSSKN